MVVLCCVCVVTFICCLVFGLSSLHPGFVICTIACFAECCALYFCRRECSQPFVLLVVCAINSTGTTALHMALHLQMYGVARDLITLKADPNARLGNGCTPLIQCIDQDELGVGQVLLDAKADPNIGEVSDNLAPIHLIIDSENVAFLRELVLHGADVNLSMKGRCCLLPHVD